MAIRMSLPAGPITAFRASTIVGIQGPPGPQGPAGGGGSVTWAGDLVGSTSTTQFVAGIFGTPITAGAPTNGQTIVYNSGTSKWVFGSAGPTWANDLATSTNTSQWVSGISGANGTSGTVGLGDGTNTLRLTGVASIQTTSPQMEIFGSAGWALNSGVGGNSWLIGGPGGSAAAGNNTGGKGGQTLIVGGQGGASTGTAANSNGGDVSLNSGAAGTGGSGAAGIGGNILLNCRAATYAFATDNAAGPGFGIGTTPGTDPTLTRGTGVPGTTQTNGSLFLRTDGSSGSNALYAREGGVWYAIGGTTTANAALNFEGQPFQLAAIGNGNGTISWPAATTAATITQTTPASDVGVNGLLIQSQSAFATASTFLTGSTLTLKSGAGATTNGSSGNIVLTAPAATGSGTQGQIQSERTDGRYVGKQRLHVQRS